MWQSSNLSKFIDSFRKYKVDTLSTHVLVLLVLYTLEIYRLTQNLGFELWWGGCTLIVLTTGAEVR
jgi:hypothetical protein